MAFLLILASLTVIGAIAAHSLGWRNDLLQSVSALVSCIAGLVLAVALIAIPVNRMGCRDQIAQIEAIRNTKPISEIQDAAWRMKAADANAQLASMKYWKRTTFGLWIPDEVDAVEPLQ